MSTDANATETEPLTPIRFRFDTHGLGDCCHCATALQLYKRRGHDIEIQVEANKLWMWRAAGIPIYGGPETLPLHPYHYPGSFWDLAAPDATASKIAHLIQGVDAGVLPRLGMSPNELWREVCGTQVDVTPSISPEAHAAAERFLEGLPRPIFVLHSRGTNWASEKSIPHGVAFEAIMLLLEQTKGSVVVLDFDARAPSLAGHARCRAILPDAGINNLETMAALFCRTDLLIGIDSGPFHFGAMTPGLRMLGVFRHVPAVRCTIPNENATYLVPGRDHIHWQRRLDQSVNIPSQDDATPAEPHWNLIEYSGDEPTAQEIVTTAIEALVPPQVSRPDGATWQVAEDFIETLESIPGDWLYRRLGHDERRLQLLHDGSIGHGAAGCEQQWRLGVDRRSGAPVLRIYGEDTGETLRAALVGSQPGVFSGHWNIAEKMPTALIRIPQICTGYDMRDGRQHRWTAAEAAEEFPGYQPGWGLPVGTRGNGAAWLLDPAISRSDLDLSDHEDWIFRHLDLPPGAVCLDLASFVGTNAAWWAQRGVTVIAVEPLPASRGLLHKNLELNRVTDRVTVIPKAFSWQPGTMRMQSGLHFNSHIGDEGDVSVDVTTVDIELLPHLSRLDLMKIDVEGAECDVITGASATIRRFRPRLVIEVHGHMDGRSENGRMLELQLSALGYRHRVIWKNSDQYYYIEAHWAG